MIDYNAWLAENAELTDPPMTVFDTTEGTPGGSADGVAAWVSRPGRHDGRTGEAREIPPGPPDDLITHLICTSPDRASQARTK